MDVWAGMLQFSTYLCIYVKSMLLDNIKLDVPEAETHNDPHMTNIREV